MKRGSGWKSESRPLTVGELMTVQMKVSETFDSRIRSALLWIAAVHLVAELVKICDRNCAEGGKKGSGWRNKTQADGQPRTSQILCPSLHKMLASLQCRRRKYLVQYKKDGIRWLLCTDTIQVLRAADELEKDLVQTAVEDSVDSDHGCKEIIHEMPSYEAVSAIANLVKV
ncbi:hypothetical protein Nepgr_013699 [Nepenthes gracilis]|uniref:Uncharacterized protein n=1 Tax=Nepenthes gracilis TaxID=150966 RepID=A0AAD3SIF4_NEPGR|nr:hypothetical protein Nepgr_013699 [Nepenthes gracilis]